MDEFLEGGGRVGALTSTVAVGGIPGHVRLVLDQSSVVEGIEMKLGDPTF